MIFWFKKCNHLNTRCIHGDEILQVMKVYTFRFWRPELTYRQMCLDCGRPLDRESICTRINRNVHIWHGTWVNRR